MELVQSHQSLRDRLELESRMLGNKHVRFGGGADRKGRKSLAGGLLYTVTITPKEAA
jgi:hypothetical protein